MHQVKAEAPETENDDAIARALQEEYDFEYRISKKAAESKAASKAASEEDFLEDRVIPRLKSFFSTITGGSSAAALGQQRAVNVFEHFSFYRAQLPEELPDEGRQREVSFQLEEQDIEPQQASFLRLLRSDAEFASIGGFLKTFINEFVSVHLEVYDQIQVIDEFLKFLQADLIPKAGALASSPESAAAFLVMAERFVMSNLYVRLFDPEIDRETGAALTEKLKQHAWIAPSHLDLKSDVYESHPLLQSAIEEIGKIDFYRSPRDKMRSISRASAHLYSLLRQQQEGHEGQERQEGGADDFLPLMIYAVIRAQPSRLYANVQYIARFKRYESSEDAYYFTNLIAIVTWCERLSRSSLTITRSDYDAAVASRDAGALDDYLIDWEGIRIKNVFREPFRKFSSWIDRDVLHN